MASNYTTRYKKDLSTQTLKAKIVRRKSLLQKESRHKEFNRGRQFGPVDVNTQAARDRELSRLDESGEVHSPKSSAKPSQLSNAAAKTRGQERLEMLQRYKAEKELRKLKEQREKPIFKCGRFQPEGPSFLPKASQIPVLTKGKERKPSTTEVPSVRVTRSKAKNQLQEPVRPQLPVKAPNYASKSVSRAAQQKQIYIDKPSKKESKEVQRPASTIPNGRITRGAAAAKTKIPQVSRPAAAIGNPPQNRSVNKGRQQKGVKDKGATVCEMEEDPLALPLVEEVTVQSRASPEPHEAFPEKENLPPSHIPGPALSRRTRSFAPQNFVFKPLEGLAAYRVKPMSPSRANVFLSPDLVWNPVNCTSGVPGEGAEENGPKDCSLKYQTSPEPKEDPQEHHLGVESSAPEEECVPLEKLDVTPSEREPVAGPPAAETTESTGEPQHDVPYFRKILQSETQRLASHCEQWDGTAETDIPEDAKDLVRTTIGQTRLLIAERFKQFEGLVDNCEFKRGEKETTCTDLDGFWDMVNFQIEDVNKKFENLKTLQVNGWQAVEDVQSKKPSKKKGPPPFPRATKARCGSAERRAARKRLAAIKAAVKSKMKPEGPIAEVSEPERPASAETLVFDGGFFQIESPAKPLPGWTPRSSSRPSRRATPRSVTRALLQSCADTCVVRHGTPAPSLPGLNGSVGPRARDLLEQSDIQAAEEPGLATEGRGEEAIVSSVLMETQRATGDSGPCSANAEHLGSASFQGLESPSVLNEAPETMAEVGSPLENLIENHILYGPEKGSQMEGVDSWTAEQHPLEGPLLEDFSSGVACDDGDTDCQPNPDASLLFTPLRSKAENHVGATVCDDLIAFSPLSLPGGGKEYDGLIQN
ncbi:disks large-associated protein 5 isoform X1 [Pogona vitticeps]